MALDLDTFKKNLKNGKYATAAGANRAIGKAGGMKKTEKEAAKKSVARKFKS